MTPIQPKLLDHLLWQTPISNTVSHSSSPSDLLRSPVYYYTIKAAKMERVRTIWHPIPIPFVMCTLIPGFRINTSQLSPVVDPIILIFTPSNKNNEMLTTFVQLQSLAHKNGREMPFRATSDIFHFFVKSTSPFLEMLIY